MARNEWLAVAGIIVGLFGIINQFIAGNVALIIFILILLALIFLIAGYAIWIFSLPPWTLLSSKTRLIISDPKGRTATGKKEITLRANQGGSKYYTHRNISSDGNLDISLDPDVKELTHLYVAHDHHVTVEFPTQIKRKGIVTTWIEFVFEDAFMNENEAMIVLVDQPI